MTKQEYQEYLQSEHWKCLKIQARLEFPLRKCYICSWKSDKITFHLHHKTYERLYHERINDLVWLCCTCHKYVHDLMKIGKFSNLNQIKFERIKSLSAQYELNKKRKIFKKQKSYIMRSRH